ncbi:protein ENHANCED DISEASE RESISTANCE 2-like isoform X2 [Zingiber officinale]|uniref:protein ENHANCED DISEASE RESISTANCE 2-like isoform X2 n=1 Tax=Zingiber officinale TaxID=94328 RepID=UPI001C4C25CF|nr:protein ENHANCED DISEASE RESISTANCE 2-like isoform X2 [Zingiber officinale]
MGSREGGGEEEKGGNVEGWLYLFRSNRFGLHYPRKRYFVLDRHRNALDCYRDVPDDGAQVPVRSANIDSCIRVNDNGRENIMGNAFFLFTLHNTSNDRKLKLGTRSSEEAAKWINTLMEAKFKECAMEEPNVSIFSKRRCASLRLRRSLAHSADWDFFSSLQRDRIISDVIEPSSWTIFGCDNGLRLFKEGRKGNRYSKHHDENSAIMAVGVVGASPEAIFHEVISLGPSRLEWDYCFNEASIIEHLDGHTDIIHVKFRHDWLPRGMKPRDVLIRRYWRREEDGTYVILFQSVFHQKCQPHRGCKRAYFKDGGYVITPINQGKESVVKHMLAIDWKLWMPRLFTSAREHITIRMLKRVAALREMFRAKLGNCPGSDVRFSLREEAGLDLQLPVQNGIQEHTEDSRESDAGAVGMNGSFLEANDTDDEFFDFLDESEYEQQEDMWTSYSPFQARRSPAAALMKRWHGLAVQTKSCIGEASLSDDAPFCSYGSTLLKDSSFSLASTWATADPSTFLIRGKTYLRDRKKIAASGTLMELVAADWLKSDKREDDLSGRSGGIVQKHAAQFSDEFFFVVNFQMPGSTTYNLALYYMMNMPVDSIPLLKRFVGGDDAYRNSRFKLIPHIAEGPWIVKQSVGKKACLVGRALDVNYFHGTNYLEVDIDIGSSMVAKGVASLVLGCLTNLVAEMAILIQGNSDEELPEFLLGTYRLNHIDPSKAVSLRSR